MRNWLFGLIALCVGESAATDALAQGATRERNFNADIAALTHVIESPESTPSQRARALDERANIYFLIQHDLDAAVADLDAALVLFPNDADRLVFRGAYRSTAGQPELALPDFNAAIVMLPDAVAPFRARGIALLHLGRFSEAATDLQQSLLLNPDLPFAALELHVARMRLGQDDRGEFDRNTARFVGLNWPVPLLAFFRGELAVDALFQAATSAPSSDRTGNLCEAAYFVGQSALVGEDIPRARALFQMASEVCPFDFSERSGALAELARLP